jgi:hypothetical protein
MSTPGTLLQLRLFTLATRSIPIVTTTQYRIVYLLLGLALIAVIVGTVLLLPSGEEAQLPEAVESYSPADRDIVLQPVRVVLDLAPNYEARFVIDGISVPPDQVDSIPATGRHQFDPGPGKVIERWTSGDHTVVATYIGPRQLDVGTVVWTFRVQ